MSVGLFSLTLQVQQRELQLITVGLRQFVVYVNTVDAQTKGKEYIHPHESGSNSYIFPES